VDIKIKLYKCCTGACCGMKVKVVGRNIKFTMTEEVTSHCQYGILALVGTL